MDLNIDMAEVYVLSPSIQQMNQETYKGRIIHQLKDSDQKISYNRTKKGLVKTNKVIEIDVPDWLPKVFRDVF